MAGSPRPFLPLFFARRDRFVYSRYHVLLRCNESVVGTKRTSGNIHPMSASLIGRLGSSTFRLSTTPASMSLTGSRLFGIGTKALPAWDPRMRWNSLLGGLTGRLTAGPSGHTISPYPSSREGHHPTVWWSSSFLLSHLILFDFHAATTSLAHRNSVPSTNPQAARPIIPSSGESTTSPPASFRVQNTSDC